MTLVSSYVMFLLQPCCDADLWTKHAHEPLATVLGLLESATRSSRGCTMALVKTLFFCHRFNTRINLLCESDLLPVSVKEHITAIVNQNQKVTDFSVSPRK